jgi:hypothetical protein
MKEELLANGAPTIHWIHLVGRRQPESVDNNVPGRAETDSSGMAC